MKKQDKLLLENIINNVDYSSTWGTNEKGIAFQKGRGFIESDRLSCMKLKSPTNDKLVKIIYNEYGNINIKLFTIKDDDLNIEKELVLTPQEFYKFLLEFAIINENSSILSDFKPHESMEDSID